MSSPVVEKKKRESKPRSWMCPITLTATTTPVTLKKGVVGNEKAIHFAHVPALVQYCSDHETPPDVVEDILKSLKVDAELSSIPPVVGGVTPNSDMWEQQARFLHESRKAPKKAKKDASSKKAKKPEPVVLEKGVYFISGKATKPKHVTLLTEKIESKLQSVSSQFPDEFPILARCTNKPGINLIGFASTDGEANAVVHAMTGVSMKGAVLLSTTKKFSYRLE